MSMTIVGIRNEKRPPRQTPVAVKPSTNDDA